MDSRLSIAVVGSVTVCRNGRPLAISLKKSLAVLVVLALSAPSAVSREKIMALLWSESDPQAARTGLRQALHQLRRELGPDAPAVLRSDSDALALAWVVTDVGKALAEARRGAMPSLLEDRPTAFLDIAEGLDAIDEGFATWISVQRQHLHEEALEHLVEALAMHEPSEPAGTRIARLLLRMEPTHEVACRFLIRTHHLRGNVAAALSVYNDLWERLDREFDALPSDETQRLIVAIKQNEPGAAPSEAEPPAPRGYGQPPGAGTEELLSDQALAVPGLPRDALENLALRFGHENPDAPEAQLIDFLKAKAAEWKLLRARLAALEAADARLANIRGAAEGAIERGDFDGAEAILAAAEELQQAERTLAEVRKQADVRKARADTLLLKGDTDAAARHFKAAAEFLVPFDRMEAASSLHGSANRLVEHARRFGGSGFRRAVEFYRCNLEVRTQRAYPVDWAATQNALGIALARQAERTAAPRGEELFGEAAAAHRAALEVYERGEHPQDWAKSQSNLGLALVVLATRKGYGATQAALLAEAVLAFRAALQVQTRVEHPMDWARTEDNLGYALRRQAMNAINWTVVGSQWVMAGNDISGGAALLDEAVAAHRAALEIRTRTDCPRDWAITQNRLGRALLEQAWLYGTAGAEPAGEAMAAFRAALEVHTRAQYPVSWANLQNNLGTALRCQALQTEGKAEATALLDEAMAAFRAVLEVRTRADDPIDWARAQRNLGLALEEMGDRGGTDAARCYRDALACFEAALTVFDHGGNHEACTAHRQCVAEKLASAAGKQAAVAAKARPSVVHNLRHQ
jgi:DNA-binding SARP family transcriptional activator